MMPEGLVKISQGLYESILPLVKTQVESQIKVRDLSRASVTITPAEFASWADARAELLTEAKRPLKAQFEAEMAGAANDAETRQIRAAFDQREKAIEHEIDRECRIQNPYPLTLCYITSQLTLSCVCIRRQAARDAPFAWRQLREYNASTTAFPLTPTYIHTQSNMQLLCVRRTSLRSERVRPARQDRIGHVRNSGTPSLSGRVVYGIIKR